MNRRPVGRWDEWADAQWEELNPGIHLVIRGSPALWNIVDHVKNGEKIAEKGKTGRKCEKSTGKSTREGEKWPEKPGSGKGMQVERNSRVINPKRWKWKREHRNEEIFG